MATQQGRNKIAYRMIIFLLLALSLVAAIIKIFTGIDIDEAYAIALPYRLLQGDRLFADMWEVHQTSAFLPALFLWLYHSITGGVTGIVLYMRVVTTLLHLGMSVVVYRYLLACFCPRGERKLSADGSMATEAEDSNGGATWQVEGKVLGKTGYTAFLLAILYFNFLPKWMMNMDFSMQQLWFFTLFVMALLRGLCLVPAAGDYDAGAHCQRYARQRDAGAHCGSNAQQLDDAGATPAQMQDEKSHSYSAAYLILAGLALAADVLAYPGMLVLYPVTLVLIIFYSYKSHNVAKEKNAAEIDAAEGTATDEADVPTTTATPCKVKKMTGMSKILAPCLWLTLGCAVLAILFLGYVFSYMSLSELIAAVPRIFMDESHQYNWSEKIALYASQWGEFLGQSVILLLPAAVLAAVACVLERKFTRPSTSTASGEEVDYDASLSQGSRRARYFLWLCIAFTAWTSALICGAWLITSWGPFRIQMRYFVQLMMGFALVCVYCRGEKKIKHTAIITMILSLAAFMGVLLASNVGPSSSSSYLVLANLVYCGLLLYVAYQSAVPTAPSQHHAAPGASQHTATDDTAPATPGILPHAATLAVLLFIASLLFCKGFYMRNTEYVYGDITESLTQITQGPLSGIYIRSSEYEKYQGDYETISSLTTEDDVVLFLGTDVLANLYTDGTFVTPTTISTPAIGDMWVSYFTLYPDKLPDVIFLAKNTVDNREKFFAQNSFGIWMGQYYDIEGMEETDSLCIFTRIQ